MIKSETLQILSKKKKKRFESHDLRPKPIEVKTQLCPIEKVNIVVNLATVCIQKLQSSN